MWWKMACCFQLSVPNAHFHTSPAMLSAAGRFSSSTQVPAVPGCLPGSAVSGTERPEARHVGCFHHKTRPADQNIGT